MANRCAVIKFLKKKSFKMLKNAKKNYFIVDVPSVKKCWPPLTKAIHLLLNGSRGVSYQRDLNRIASMVQIS